MTTLTKRKVLAETRSSALINFMRQRDAYTENYCVTNSTSLNACVDLFFIAGATRSMSESQIINMFVKALSENPLIAMKILFWARDIRGGQGERRFFRLISKYLDTNYSKFIRPNIKYIPEYGRWDDMFKLDEKTIMPLILKGLKNTNTNGLLAKWLPRQGEFANKIRKYMKLTPKGYRKMIVALSNTVEQKMSAKEFDSINYEQVPSIAMNRYRKAFFRNDPERFKTYIENVITNKKKINASTLNPLDLFEAWKKGDDKAALEAQWNALPNYMESSKERLLPMCDVSESMFRDKAIAASISLGIYISERNEGIFKDAFLTFTSEPRLQYLKGSFTERCKQMEGPIGYDTNLQAAFEMLLNTAIRNKVSQLEMPTKLLIISDMEFNEMYIRKPDATALDMIYEKYKDAGYTVPQIIFWNVRGRQGNVPAKATMKGVGLISGYNPSILTSILSGKIITPELLMLKTVYSKRYDLIKV